MNTKLFILILLTPTLLCGQTTLIPDIHFEEKLIQLGYDSGTPDGSVPTANINSITHLYASGFNIALGDITDLTGIEDFVSLTNLYCRFNDIDSLDLSNNTALTHIDCSYNFIKYLNISNSTQLSYLNCGNNLLVDLDLTNNPALDSLTCRRNHLPELDLTTNEELIYLNILGQTYGTSSLQHIDISNNTNLVELHCGANKITSLDLSNHSELTDVTCYLNQLTSLNMKNGNNLNMVRFKAGFNPNLECITVDEVDWATNNWTPDNYDIDSTVNFSTNCSATSVEENSFLDIKIYPNPTNGKCIIQLPMSKEVIIIVSDILGNKIHQSKKVFQKLDLDLKKITSEGIFIVKIMDVENNLIAIKKIVVR